MVEPSSNKILNTKSFENNEGTYPSIYNFEFIYAKVY